MAILGKSKLLNEPGKGSIGMASLAQHTLLSRAAIIIPLILALAGCASPAPLPTATPLPPTQAARPSATPQPTGMDTPQPSPTPQPTQTETPQPTQDPNNPPACTETGQTWTSPVDGMTLVCVPAGEFTMGTESSDPASDEPAHQVMLDAFWIDQTEVTNAMYQQCVAAGACTAPRKDRSSTRINYYDASEYATFPVVYASWDVAASYCRWAGRTLPTEAQWEKAARGTDGRIYPWGNQAPTCRLANFGNCVADTNAVGNYPKGVSPYGAYDMAGNVYEWVADWYGEGYYSQSPSANPTGPSSGDSRVVRGGTWSDDALRVRATDRNYNRPDFDNFYYGFRCAWSLEP